MKGKRRSKEQVISILKAREAWLSAVNLAKKHRVAEQSTHR